MTRFIQLGGEIIEILDTDGDGKHALAVQLVTGIDSVTRAYQVVDYGHSEVHSGGHFFYASAQDLTNAQTITFLVVTPNTTEWSHFGFELDGQAEYDVQLFEDATPDANGTPVTNPAIINNNRNSLHAPTLQIFATPTLGAGSKGTLIKRFHAGSGKASGGMAGTGEELILKQNTKYWVDLKNETTSNNFIAWLVGWYEHTNKA